MQLVALVSQLLESLSAVRFVEKVRENDEQAIDAFVSGVGQAVLVGSIILIVTAVAVAIIAPSGMSQDTVMSDSDDEQAQESDPISSLRGG